MWSLNGGGRSGRFDCIYTYSAGRFSLGQFALHTICIRVKGLRARHYRIWKI